MGRVAIVDDDTLLRGYYVEAFKLLGYEVSVLDGPANLDFAEVGDLDLLVIDLMMPKPSQWGNRIEENELLTGLYFCKDLRQDGAKTPIVLFSSLNIKSLADHVSEAVKNIENVVFVLKADFEPILFAQACDEILRTGSTAGMNASLGRRLARSLLIQPNIAGFGCDCKKFLTK